MLTCKVGENIVNTFDYNDEQIRKWSNKSILKCPVCDGNMIYKHGLIKIAHFAHEKNECTYEYYEPETEEHLMGKKMIYDMLFKFQLQGLITNVKLEYYIKETKQRPDLYFEKDGERFVIEFQCTPIASEYLERCELYKLANITQLWILGTEKYNIEKIGGFVEHLKYYKVIEKRTNHYLSVSQKEIYTNGNLIKKYLPHCKLHINDYDIWNINDISLANNSDVLYANNILISELISKDIEIHKKEIEMEAIKINELLKNKEIIEIQKTKDSKQSKIRELFVAELNKICKNKYSQNIFTYKCGNAKYYEWAIEFNFIDSLYMFYFKSECIDFCEQYEYSYQYDRYNPNKRHNTKRWGKKTGWKNIKKLNIIKENNEAIIKFILECVLPDLKKDGWMIGLEMEGINAK